MKASQEYKETDMDQRSQAFLENQLIQRENQVEEGKLTMEAAFGNLDDWIIQLGEQKALLHPNLKQWMWYGRLHEEWVFAGCGTKEGILLSFGKLCGMKLLPKLGAVDPWCVYSQNETMHGPMQIGELYKELTTKKGFEGVLIWSTQSPNWLEVSEAGKGFITLHSSEDGAEYSLKEDGEFTKLPKKPKVSKKGKK